MIETARNAEALGYAEHILVHASKSDNLLSWSACSTFVVQAHDSSVAHECRKQRGRGVKLTGALDVPRASLNWCFESTIAVCAS